MLNNLVSANVFMVAFFIFDAVLILAAIGLLVWYFMKSKNGNQNSSTVKTKYTSNNEGVAKIDDDTYVLANDEPVVEEPAEPIQKDNVVEHFVNQISDINEDASNELSSNAIVVKHEVEQPVKKVPKKDEIHNYVMVGGVKKEKTETEKIATQNRGTDAFKNSTNFLNLIKEEQKEFSVPGKSAVAAKPAAPVAKKTTTAAKKTTTTKKTTK